MEIVTSSAKPQEDIIPMPSLLVKDESKKAMPPQQPPTSKLISEPIFEDDLYDDGEFTYDQYGNIVGRVSNQLARDRWHWAFTKIVQVRKLIFIFYFLK